MMPLSHVLRKCSGEYKLNKSQEKINHLKYMDDIKLFAKNKKNKKKQKKQKTKNGNPKWEYRVRI